MRGKIITILFIILIFGFGAFNLLMPDQAFSENENRYLAQSPPFSPSALADGSYMQKLGEYMTDQFLSQPMGWVKDADRIVRWQTGFRRGLFRKRRIFD